MNESFQTTKQPSQSEAKSQRAEFSLENLKRVVVSRLTNIESLDDLICMAKMLWSKRYNLPQKHPLLKEYTVYELLLEMVSWEFLDNPENIDDFIRKDNGIKDAILEDDEKWFKAEMGVGYTSEEYHTEDYYNYVNGLKTKKNLDVDTLPDGEYDFK